MNIITRYISFCIITLLISCKQEKQTPKVIYEEAKETIEPKKIDTTSIKIADLPIHMEGTKFLIHPVGDVRVYDDYSKVYGSSKTNQVSYAISNYNRFEITGYFENLKFQHIDSTRLIPLTENKIQIQTVTFLNTIAEKTVKQILVYILVDSDTNKDGKVDQNDIKSLYISHIDGSGFVKLSEPLQELIDWNIIETQNRLYFRCIGDINKNGAFDKNDKVHYYFVNLLAEEWKVEEYIPI
ncbi:hypothetical protein FIA58_005895 [Flavobacterium jejuense]|uniref:EF-hand domain-containing protein n=1 Tax=Flavobacterium jejuense TaxID=1544455 RepID=A0ABX0IN27_9FLAO|nr:hypothetical protein [Flavobacterium jejuense]NHN25207.1 hypothetical protein [Flavobacterium jejuense]